jgi:hypothetical protein
VTESGEAEPRQQRVAALREAVGLLDERNSGDLHIPSER